MLCSSLRDPKILFLLINSLTDQREDGDKIFYCFHLIQFHYFQFLQGALFPYRLLTLRGSTLMGY